MEHRLFATRALFALGIATAGCHGPAPKPAADAPEATSAPTLRVFAVTDVSGALEPCGCQKDMLGGLGPAAATLARARKDIGASVTVAAGPLFFAESQSPPHRLTQDIWKAEALARSLPELGLVAWAPAANDWADGNGTLAHLTRAAGITPLAANLLAPDLPLAATHIIDRGGIRVGFAGISAPGRGVPLPLGVAETEPGAALARAARELEDVGATVRVALLAAPRGLALAWLEQTPGFHAAVLGRFASDGEPVTPTPPTLVGDTLVVNGGSQLERVVAIDFVLVPGDDTFVDGAGIGVSAHLAELDQRVAELERRIAAGRAAGAAAADLEARATELQHLRAERTAHAAPRPPAVGSRVSARVIEVRASAGTSPRVTTTVRAHSARVNEHNRVALADRAPPPPPPNGNGFVGVELCGACHEAALQQWQTTRHAGAYATLESRRSQFDLECVGCHVTGYEQPGGSSVVQVQGLTGVQCEICHGPGALHSARPGEPGLVKLTPERTLCATRCHKPPHVPATWTVEQAWPHSIGPGHGMPASASSTSE